MAQPKLLEGEVMEPTEDQKLRDLNRTLTRQLHDAMEENDRLRKRLAQGDAPVARLRETLTPFYQLLQQLFGEMDAIAPEAAKTAATAQPAASPVWEAWKQRLGQTVAKGITALQTHGELNTQQLAMATGLNRKTITNSVVFQLNKAGLINKNGGRFSLKQI